MLKKFLALLSTRKPALPTALDARLELIAENGGPAEIDLHHYQNAPSFLKVFQQLSTTIGQPISLIGHSGHQEMAWQALFDHFPWGKEARREIQRLTHL